MHRLLILCAQDGSPDTGPHLGREHQFDSAVSHRFCAPEDLGAAVESADATWVCVADPSTRFTTDGLRRTLVALDEPAITSAADSLIHHSEYLLFEGEEPRVREVYRLHIGEGARAASPTAILGGAMAQPGALVVRRQWLADSRGLLGGSSAIAINDSIVRRLGSEARLLVMPWVLSERITRRDSHVLDLGDALHLDIRYQTAIGELWRHAWSDDERASVHQMRMLHALSPLARPRSLARRVAGRLRRAWRARRW